MRLASIDIRSLPGIDPIHLDDFQPGINFIVGPNAVGKSSLIRALHLLLAPPRRGDPTALSLAATLIDGTTEWQLDRQGAQQRWSRAGVPTDPPVAPDPEALHCYWLDAQSLLAPDEAREDQLRRRFQAALAGGIDIAQVRSAAGIQAEPFPRGLYQSWREARSRWQKTERAYQALEDDRETLARLKAEQRQARSAAETVARIQRAQELHQAIANRRLAEQALATFPETMAAMRGDEDEQAHTLSAQRQQIDTELARIDATLEENRQRQQDTGLVDSRISRSLIATLRQRLEALWPLAERLDLLQRQLAAAEGECQAAADALGADPSDPPVIDPATIESIGHALQRRNEAIAWTLRLGGKPTTTTRLGQALGAIATAAGLTTAGLGWAADLPLITLAAALGAIAGVFVVVTPLLGGKEGVRAATAHREAAEHELGELLSRSGIGDLDYRDVGIPRLLSLTRTLDEARARVQAIDAERRCTRTQYDERLAAVQDALSTWLTTEAADPIAIQQTIQDLDDRLRDLEQLRQARESLQARRDEAMSRRAVVVESQSSLFARLGIEPDDQAELANLTEQYRAYQQARQRLEQAREAERQLALPLQDDAALLAQAQADDDRELRQSLETHQRIADGLDDLTTRIARIERDLEQAGDDDALATALTESTGLAEQLAQRRERHVEATLGVWLLDEVEQDYRRNHEPGLIREARTRFEAFTQGHWSLVVDAQHNPQARDLRAAATRSLTELSAGTRMQLLLAARLAWARSQERGGPALPLALDEALANTDAERFTAIAGNLASLAAADGRQIFYLTTRQEDIQLWAAATGETPHCIDLAAQGRRRRRPSHRFVTAPRPPVPSPDGMDPVAYAETLEVPAVDLARPAESIHLFHLLRDHLPGLHQLLDNWRIDTLGPLEVWLQSPAGENAHIRNQLPDDLSKRAVVARRWLELARQGRGRPVDREALVGSGALSEKMLARVDENATEMGGDGARLIAALRDRAIPRLKRDAIDQLEQWLIDGGWIDPRPMLDAEGITRALLDELGHRIAPDRIRSISDWLAAGSGQFV